MTKSIEEFSKELVDCHNSTVDSNVPFGDLNLKKHFLFCEQYNGLSSLVKFVALTNKEFDEIKIYTDCTVKTPWSFLKQIYKDKITVEHLDEIPEIDINNKKKTLFIVDSVYDTATPRVLEYLCMGRPLNYTCCFFSKLFSNCPSIIKNLVRYIVITSHMPRIYQLFKRHDIKDSDVKKAINNAIKDGGGGID